MRKSNTFCVICNKPLYRRPSEFKKDISFCCRGCRSILYKQNPQKVKNLDKGRGWNKGMSKKNGDILIYGRPRSAKTKNRMSISAKIAKPVNLLNHIIVKCLFCGKDIKTYKSNHNRGNAKFCSKSCSTKFANKNRKYDITGCKNPNWKGGINSKSCLICGNIFYPRKKTSKYCCAKCRNKAHSFYMINNPPTIHTYDTDIEKILELFLKQHNITFEKQKIIKNISTPDFFIKPNICLYADGDYWHNIPKVKNRDNRINKTLEFNGYKVIRILGSDIKKGAIDYDLFG